MVKQLAQRLAGFKSSLKAVHEAGTSQPNEAKGTEREAVLSLVLEGVFPNANRFGTGSVIDLYGRQSGQLDIVIERPSVPSFPIPGTSSRLYPFESVAGILEVKSSLDTQWSEVLKTCAQLAPLRAMEQIHHAIKTMPHEQIGFAAPDALSAFLLYTAPEDFMKVPAYVFAYTGWVDHTYLHKRMIETPPPAGPSSVYVLDNDYYLGWDRLSPVGDVKANLHVVTGKDAFGEFLADLQKTLTQIYAVPPFLHFYVRQSEDAEKIALVVEAAEIAEAESQDNASEA